jgi:hypothetical protein
MIMLFYDILADLSSEKLNSEKLNSEKLNIPITVTILPEVENTITLRKNLRVIVFLIQVSVSNILKRL